MKKKKGGKVFTFSIERAAKCGQFGLALGLITLISTYFKSTWRTKKV
jgi:hypothetical protein